MASEAELQLLVGELRGRVAALEEQNRRMLQSMESMASQLREINETLNTAAGGWRTLLAVGTVGAAIGGFVVATLNLVKGG